MRAYVVTTGVVFALITVAHIWRYVEEGSGLFANPWFSVITIATAALAIWAWRLARSPT